MNTLKKISEVCGKKKLRDGRIDEVVVIVMLKSWSNGDVG